MRKYVVFDFDGTIVSSMELAEKLYNELAEKYGVRKLDREAIKLFRKLTIPERIKLLEVPIYLIPKMVLEFKKKYQQHIGTLREIDGIREIIMELKRRGYSLAIISSNTVSNIKQFLKNNMLDLFDPIYASKALFGKQSTLQTLAKNLKIGKEQMIYVGDELRDIESCKKAGVDMIAVTWGFDTAEYLSRGNPEYLIHQPSDMLSILHPINEAGQ